MKDDAEIQQNVVTELKWSPDIEEIDIAVKVTRGIVTLTGFVHTYPEKFRAKAAVKRVAGVVAVANDIEVRLPALDTVSDPEIARDAMDALRRVLPIAWESIRLIVRQGKGPPGGYSRVALPTGSRRACSGWRTRSGQRT